ncbi:glycoside hydrolase family 16 protein [Phanerochaete sordida]|uniref:Glycoside hydrolase family 16 protein n=1 Tax=Phanerochaete sordida TaxID=48140 RepID=A0A9P3L9Y2_9APHY|nr:glycoside hydrolase family 16 protein [Phanerochaete sordida]
MRSLGAFAALLCYSGHTLAFDVLRDYSGQNFFNGWDFYGYWDNLTLGDVWWLNQSDAMAQNLAYINPAGNAIIKVDNTTTVAPNDKRNTVRITTSDFYDYGSLWVIDALHIPYGCSVWPAFWSKGSLWPNDGEIDIIESINLNPNNQMALHTTAGCFKDASAAETGRIGGLNCGTGSGCVVVETAPNSYESGFAAAGGGVWATQFDVSGIYIWFWGRDSIPPSLTQATSTSSIDISDFGLPSASYPANPQCNLTQFFTPQQLVIDITLCGDWAGVPAIYGPQCGSAGPTGSCYQDNVVGPGSPKYDEAYFEIKYVRTYTTLAAGAVASAPTSTASVPLTISATNTPSPTGGSGSGSGPNASPGSEPPSSLNNTSAAARDAVLSWAFFVALSCISIGLLL